MSKQTAVKLILAKFNLLSDNDFKSWMLNYHDELIQMEREQIVEAYYYDPNCDEIKDDGELYYKQTYGGQDEQR
jgi:hypothetical protein